MQVRNKKGVPCQWLDFNPRGLFRRRSVEAVASRRASDLLYGRISIPQRRPPTPSCATALYGRNSTSQPVEAVLEETRVQVRTKKWDEWVGGQRGSVKGGLEWVGGQMSGSEGRGGPMSGLEGWRGAGVAEVLRCGKP